MYQRRWCKLNSAAQLSPVVMVWYSVSAYYPAVLGKGSKAFEGVEMPPDFPLHHGVKEVCRGLGTSHVADLVQKMWYTERESEFVCGYSADPQSVNVPLLQVLASIREQIDQLNAPVIGSPVLLCLLLKISRSAVTMAASTKGLMGEVFTWSPDHQDRRAVPPPLYSCSEDISV